MTSCANHSIYQYLTEPKQLIVQSIIYLLVCSTIAYWLTRSGVKSPSFQAAIIGILSAVTLLIIIDPGPYLALIALLGSLLGGVVAEFRSKQTVMINEPSND